ncbi:MAG: hypothetical protein FWH46_01250 [Methanimicrococcus sp.]|nr:hypothetical protein [Methanimicrococcus sp.]
MLKLLDTSSIILILEEIKCPEIFNHCIERGHTLGITGAVYDELSANPNSFEHFKKYEKISVIRNDHQKNSKTYEYLTKRYHSLHEGEISVLCEAVEMSYSKSPCYCIVDDHAARKRKDELGIQLTGTIGFLLWGKKNGCFNEEECQKLHQKIKKSRFRIDSQILEKLLT